MSLTGHKNVNSLKHYTSEPTHEEKAEMSSLLHDIEPATKKRRNDVMKTNEDDKSMTERSSDNNTIHVSSTHVMSSLFAGAHFCNTTINVNCCGKDN